MLTNCEPTKDMAPVLIAKSEALYNRLDYGASAAYEVFRVEVLCMLIFLIDLIISNTLDSIQQCHDAIFPISLQETCSHVF